MLNATRIENGEEWHYWHEGFTRGVERVMLAIDRERLAVVEALHGNGVSLLDWALAAYGAEGMQGDSYYEAMKSRVQGKKRAGPTQLESRFFTSDVPYGVAAYEQLAERVGVDHTALTAVRVLSELIIGRELKTDAFGVEALVTYAQQRHAAAGG